MKRIFFIAMMAVCSLSMQAQFSGQGSGTEKDPYLVTNADELFEVRNDLGAYYKQMNDIDLGMWIDDNTPTKGWSPIGSISTPFKGNYDGNNKTIKNLRISQPNGEKLGLFGVIQNATIKNLALVNSHIEGKNDVGGLVGYADVKVSSNLNTELSNIILIGGNISGQFYVGGVAGRLYISSYGSGKGYSIVKGCFACLQIEGSDIIGGIVGLAGSWRWSDDEYRYLNITDNHFAGRVTATEGYAGGIWGQEYTNRNGSFDTGKRHSHCLRNISSGSIFAVNNASGILGMPVNSGGTFEMANNVCVADTISSSQGNVCIVNSTLFLNNYTIASTVYYSKGKVVSGAIDDNNIPQYGQKILQKKNTYIGMGFDFTTQWNIEEGESFPYIIKQSTPGKITEFTGGSRGKISGTAEGTGTVYVFIGNQLYESFIVDGKWELTLPNTPVGTEARVSVATGGLMPSIFVKAVAEAGGTPTPQGILGDANGDGVVDSADVTAIINYILGKPGVSFNKDNADVTGDGEILIDDAVQTVQIIMNAQ